jgi:uncharacterized integral membrane protein
MWILRWVLQVLVILILIYFGAMNTEAVTVKFKSNWEFQTQLWLVMYVSFAVGMLAWLLGSIFKILQFKTDIRKLNKENSTLKKELDKLRNISIEEEATDITEFEGEDL